MKNLLALNVPGGDYSFEPIAGMPEGPRDFQSLITFGITSLFVIATLLALAFLIWGGIQWITSGGDKSGVENARKKITWAIIGLIITLCAFLIINFVGNLLGVNPFDPRCGSGKHLVTKGHTKVCLPN